MDEKLGNLNEIPFLKNNVLEKFLNDELLVRLLADTVDVSLPALGLRYDRVYPWEYTLETTSEAAAFITMEMVATPILDAQGRRNPAVKDIHLFVYAFCHQSIMLIDDAAGARLGIPQRGTRVDLMLARIDELLNGAELASFGRLEFDGQEVISPPASRYVGKCTTYSTKNFNRTCARI